MYRITRTATLKQSANLPKAIGAAVEVQKFINESYKGFHLKIGVEMFGEARLHWTYESETLAKLEEGFAKLLQDKAYWSKVDATKDLWMDGTVKDTITMLIE